jgi:Transposase DDE domain
MDLDDFIMTVFCRIDDLLPQVTGGQRVRERGPQATLADSEVLTMEVVGEYLGLGVEQALFAYFRRHYAHFFPALRRLHRTTVERQAANLWALKERLWLRLLLQTPHDPTLGLLDSFPVPVCGFARAPRCRRFRGEAGYGRDPITRSTFYGFRLHVRVCWPGVITRVCVAPADVAEQAVAPLLAEGTCGLLLGDRNYWAPRLAADLRTAGVTLLAPYHKAQDDPTPQGSALLGSVRGRIEPIFSQLTERGTIKRVWARDRWHFGNRLLRKVLMHTLCVALNIELDQPPLQLAQLVAA